MPVPYFVYCVRIGCRFLTLSIASALDADMNMFSSLVTRDSIPHYILCIVPTVSRRFFLLSSIVPHGMRVCRSSVARFVCRLYMPVFLFLLVPFHS